jgi:RNA recognition motif-containing protein
MGKRLFIRNLSPETTESELYDLFAGVGGVRMVVLPPQHQTGERKVYGIVDMETIDLAHAALQTLNGHVLRGYTMQIFETSAGNLNASPNA